MNAHSPNAVTPVDGFDLVGQDPNASPLQGTAIRFKDEAYLAFGDEIDVRGQTYAVLDRKNGWQKLQKDCPPAYVMQMPGQPKPAQPFVEQKDWPRDLNGKPTHPYKWTGYLYLLNTSTGELSTFWSNTIGGWRAISKLQDQIVFMRRMKPDAIPIIALESWDMPTQFGSTKPAPQFKLCGWRTRSDVGPQQAMLAGPEQKEIEQKVSEPTSKEIFNDEIDF